MGYVHIHTDMNKEVLNTRGRFADNCNHQIIEVDSLREIEDIIYIYIEKQSGLAVIPEVL